MWPSGRVAVWPKLIFPCKLAAHSNIINDIIFLFYMAFIISYKLNPDALPYIEEMVRARITITIAVCVYKSTNVQVFYTDLRPSINSPSTIKMKVEKKFGDNPTCLVFAE